MPAVAGFPVADVASKLLVCKTRSLHVLEKPVLNATIVENIDGKCLVTGELANDLAITPTNGICAIPSLVTQNAEPLTLVMSGCVVFWMCSINSFSMVLSPHQANLTSLSAGGASCSVPAIPNWPGICGTISTTFSSSATYSMVVTAFVGARADLTV